MIARHFVSLLRLCSLRPRIRTQSSCPVDKTAPTVECKISFESCELMNHAPIAIIFVKTYIQICPYSDYYKADQVQYRWQDEDELVVSDEAKQMLVNSGWEIEDVQVDQATTEMDDGGETEITNRSHLIANAKAQFFFRVLNSHAHTQAEESLALSCIT